MIKVYTVRRYFNDYQIYNVYRYPMDVVMFLL
jgi:hypothetical protein